MHLLDFSFLLIYTAVAFGDTAFEWTQDYDYDQDQGDTKDDPVPTIEEQLRSASSVDELMKIIYPEYWTMLKCQSKRGGRFHFKEPSASDPGQEDEPMAFAAAHYNFEIFKSIEAEWRKTQCMPREVCLDVGKEFGAAANTFFKPTCVSVYRCGGCCNSEGLQCMNISTSYVSKTLFEIVVPLSQRPKPVTISFANHTACRCLSKPDVYRQVHSIIRRSLAECDGANRTCPKDHVWSVPLCRCVVQHDFTFAPPSPDSRSSDGLSDLCGPNKELDDESCQCVCKGGLRPSSCGPNRELDRESCQCVCKLSAASCGPNRVLDRSTCQCVCAKSCPKNQPLNPAKCTCECTETPNKCFLRGRRFRPQTCSCHAPPCRRRACETGYYFSEEVCHCVPTYWRPSR
ncbi:vascular endothelial growth factor C [Erpetoichthys calabaricus]|uniref:Vascular endothelial growth factor C n=1 Tax=Erpetoichthys calabaricus TaxID=27687 RepID=A0A8C4T7B0_ERPCA|nr:vascular endothelial growth factor C [Erpetoichthys calabaricus]